MKYLVMECRPAYAVVLGDDGRFIKVANMRYEVGQTVTDVVALNLPEVTQQAAKTNHRRWISSLAAMAACLVLVVTSIFFTGQMPYASVYMTINPEVRIDVNRNDIVVGVEGMNADGAELLEGYDHRKKNLDTVMDELVDLAIEMGYLHEGGKITLSLDANEEWVTSHGDHLNQHLNEHLTDKITVTIDIEQKQPAQETTAAPTAPTGTIVIPVGPDNYGESDYGEDATDDDGDSEYASSDDGDSAYDSLDDGQTDYDDTSDDDGQSSYASTDADDGQTDYGTSDDTDDGQSDFNSSIADDSDDGQSDYDQSDDGQSNYDESEDGESNYEDSDEDDDN